MKRVDSKAQGIRDLLTAAGRPLNIDELQPRLEKKLRQIVGKAKLYNLLSVMIADGELDSVGRGEGRFYWFRKGAA